MPPKGRPKTMAAVLDMLEFRENVPRTRAGVWGEVLNVFNRVSTLPIEQRDMEYPSLNELYYVEDTLTDQLIQDFDSKHEDAFSYECIVVNGRWYEVTEECGQYTLENEDEYIDSIPQWEYEDYWLSENDEFAAEEFEDRHKRARANNIKSQVWNKFNKLPYFNYWARNCNLSGLIINNYNPGLKARLRQYRMGVLIATDARVARQLGIYLSRMLPALCSNTSQASTLSELIRATFFTEHATMQNISVEYFKAPPTLTGFPVEWQSTLREYMNVGNMANALASRPNAVFFTRASWIYTSLINKIMGLNIQVLPRHLSVQAELANFQVPASYSHLGPIESWKDMQRLIESASYELFKTYESTAIRLLGGDQY